MLRAVAIRSSASLAAVALALPAAAQAKLFSFYGETPTGTLGYSLDSVGDIDRDGRDDVILSAVDYSTFRGYARVRSGRDGSLLYAYDEAWGGTGLGSDVAGGGDADGDGWPDFIIGAYWDSVALHYAGSARVHSGRDGSVLFTFSGHDHFSWFGLAVDFAGDVDLDGHDDLIVGGFGTDANGSESGEARVFSGFDGHLLYAFPGDAPGSEFGRSVAGLGDVDGDGNADFVAGGYDSNTPLALGYARVYSGRDGSVIRTHQGALQAGFGQSATSIGDLDGDGRSEYAIGAHFERPPWDPGIPHGAVHVYSGVDGSLLHTHRGRRYSTFGYSIAGTGDVDGDGAPDLVVGAPSVNAIAGDGRYVAVYSGANHALLFEQREGDGQFGNAVAGAGDVNADGRMDVLVADYKNEAAGPSAGVAYVLGGGCPAPRFYCTSSPNSAGAGARIGYEGGPGMGANDLVLEASGLPADQTALFYYGSGQMEHPFGDGFRCVGGTLQRLMPAIHADAHGWLSLPLDLHAPPASEGACEIEPGSTWNFQLWYRDPASLGMGFNFSDGLSVGFYP